MDIFNRNNAMNTGELPILSSWMLIGPQNSAARSISMQISEIPVGSEQPLHSHDPEQCYYIIKGQGLMFIEEEAKEVSAGSAIHIPPGKRHGIRNIGNGVLEYLTDNFSKFEVDVVTDFSND